MECCINILNIENGARRYHAGSRIGYPRWLRELVPKYIPTMPVCPEGGTYHHEMQPGGLGYSAWCDGKHPGAKPGFPRVSMGKVEMGKLPR